MPFSMALTPGFSQCDTAGNMHFPRYMEAMNNLVEAWFRERMDVDFHAFHLKDRLGLPVVNTRLEINSPSQLGERLSVQIGVETLGRSSLVVRATGHCNGEPRFTIRHRLVFISLENYRAIAIPAQLLPLLEAERLTPPASSVDPLLPAGPVPVTAHRTRLTVRTSHCDPAGIVFYARYFEMLAEAQEDWFERGLLLPVGRLLRERGRRLAVDAMSAGFERVSRLSDPLDIDLWVSALDDRGFTLSFVVSCAGEVRLRAGMEARLQSADEEHDSDIDKPGDSEQTNQQYEDQRESAAPEDNDAQRMSSAQSLLLAQEELAPQPMRRHADLPDDLREWMGHYSTP